MSYKKETIKYFARIIRNCFEKSNDNPLPRIKISEVILSNDTEARFDLYKKQFKQFNSDFVEELQEALEFYEEEVTATKFFQIFLFITNQDQENQNKE